MRDFQVIVRITINHSYSRDHICRHIELLPDPASAQLFRQRQITCKRTAPNQWVLLQSCNQNGTFRQWEDKLSMLLRFTAPTFLHYTRIDNAVAPDCILHEFAIVLPADQNEPIEISHTLEAKQMYWKYVMLPRVDNGQKRKIKLLELGNRLSFKIKENISYHGKIATVFRSEKPIALADTYPFQLRLYEEKEHGEKLLSQLLPFPRPENQEKNDEITQYIYY